MARCLVRNPDIELTDASEYFLGLDAEAQLRYKQKITINKVLMRDPFNIPSTQWADDPSLWPDVGYGDVWEYLIQTKGVYTKETLKSYKSLEAFRYFVAGHVKTLFYHDYDTVDGCAIKANVTPSQSVRAAAHKAWVLLCKSNGMVLAGHCTCMAGLGEVCSHVAAILFKIHAAVNLGLTKHSCTQEACKWNNTFQREINPRPVTDFSDLAMRNRRRPVKIAEYKADAPLASIESLKELKLSCPDAVFFTTIPQLDSDETDSASEDDDDERTDELPTHLPDLYNADYLELPKEQLFEKITTMISEMKESTSSIANLQESTTGQSASNIWFKYRKGRITASIAHQVFRQKISTNPNRLIKQIMGYTNNNISNMPAIKWGRDNEEYARKCYTEIMSKTHTGFSCKETGLHLSATNPYLAASPDGIAECSCHGKRLVEIKCPYKYRNVSPLHAASTDKKFCLNKNGKINTSHEYYTQVQFQMFCTNIHCSDFVVHTNTSTFICESIQFDVDFVSKIVGKCTTFFSDNLMPELLTNQFKFAIQDEVLSASSENDV